MSSAQVSFAAELITLLVAASGLVLVARKSDLVQRSGTARGLLGAGFAVLGTGAFLDGSLLLGSNPGSGLAFSRLLAVALITAGSLRWRVGVRLRAFLLTGLVLVTAEAVTELAAAPVVASDILLALGSTCVGFPLVVAGRRSIATRVAVASAATLLAVLVLVSVAMSQVISSSVTNQDVSRLAQRGRSEGVEASAVANDAVKGARLAAGDLQIYGRLFSPNPLVALTTAEGSRDATAQAAIVDRLNQLSQLYPVGGYAYVLPGDALAVSSGSVASAVQSVASTPGLLATSCSRAGTGRILVRESMAWAVGSFPECGANGTQVLGTVLSVSPLDGAYLKQRRQADPSVSLAFVAQGRILASSGVQPPAATLISMAARSAASGTSATATVVDRFVSVQPINAGTMSDTSLSVMASSSTTALVATREKLFRTLFLIALGSTLAALALAVLVGERISAGIRRLTDVAGRIQAGQASERVGALGTDEVGVLGAAFDSMIDSVEDHAAALRAAADDETRLRNRLEAVVAGISDSLVAVDVDGRIIELNAAAEKLFGVSVGQVRGTAVHTVIVGRGEDGTPLEGLLGRPRAVGWGSLATVRGAGQGEVPVAISAGAVRGPAGEFIGAVLILRDLRSEQELERMKSEFLSRVGHELRTPLTGIMGYADILLRREVDADRARAWHREILGGAKALLRIVEMLEFFASAGAGRVRLRPEPLDVRSLVSGVAAKWSARLGDAHPLVRRVEIDTPPVLADRRWLVLALDELIDNAAKFSPSGGRISVAAGPSGPLSSDASERPAVEISVADRGEGMTADQQARAFGDFVQLDTSDTRRFGGLGLGLALVKRVVEGHGGTVTCRSEPSRGSIFTIRLPSGLVAGTVHPLRANGHAVAALGKASLPEARFPT